MLIQGEKVALRRTRPADAQRAYEWLALSDLTPSAIGRPLYPELPVPRRETFDARYPAQLFTSGNPYAGRALVISTGDEDVGIVAYGDVRLEQAAVELEVWLAEKRFCGHGLGSEALRLACRWLHEELGIDQFVLRVSRRNLRGLRTARRAGFRATPPEAEPALRELELPKHPLADCQVLQLALAPPPARLSVEPGRIYVFLDTEFTRFNRPQLVSVGAAATDAKAFYCEISDWPREQASEFVRDVVVPLLDGDAVPQPRAAAALAEWLADRAATQPVTTVTDSAYDRWALAELLGETLPAGVRWQRVPLPAERLDAVAVRLKLRRHHALDDARALRAALLRTAG